MKLLNPHVDLDVFFKRVKKQSFLLLDYDGTLARLVIDRTKAVPYRGVKERLTTLAELKNTRVIIVSGRKLEEVEKLLDVPHHLEIWGSHGLERKLPNGQLTFEILPQKMKDALTQGKIICETYTSSIHCEIKPFAVACHFRGMKIDEKERIFQQVKKEWEKICLNADLEVHQFDEGIELRPKGKNKGDVINQILKEASKETAIAYLGDDQTDEEAFAALKDRGLKVLVRKNLRPTLADLHLVPPKELLAFLDQWIKVSNEY